MATGYTPYRFRLKTRARALRREQTPAERKLWYEFLMHQPEKFTRQKPLGRFIADFYCASHRLVVEVDGDSHFHASAAEGDQRREQELALQDIRCYGSPTTM